jgi:nucleoside 2-deoxyribosyltransferase
MTKTVYLAGPINEVTEENTRSWREIASEMLSLYDIKTLNPLRGKENYKAILYTPSEIVVRDKQDIKNSDLVLANMSVKTPLIGTSMEIGYAWEHGIPVVVWSDWAHEHYWIRYHSVKVLHSLDACVDYIVSYWG